MRSLLELYASRLQLWHLGKCLRSLPPCAHRDGHSPAATGDGLVSSPFPRRLPWLMLLSGLVLLADRLSKRWVEAHIQLGGAIPLIPRVLRITHWTNEGAAFSLFAESASPHLVRWVLGGISLLAALAVLIALVRLGDRLTLTTVALALIFAGAL